ncbi:hypothetical protein RFI_12438 [Reticulomyxa filosa]|uniref:Uncharacterized protein n=1 Tax=Reticulomyxa filosa TaxID=46433 RepID=X6NH92_RETFI|nr:hypothetical protein RFI_12438 [Reticulomyxa filosa]|eukprot:ETO24722.1 hypothetical protein RFI_12438 [Reticulomyxa filosa]
MRKIQPPAARIQRPAFKLVNQENVPPAVNKLATVSESPKETIESLQKRLIELSQSKEKELEKLNASSSELQSNGEEEEILECLQLLFLFQKRKFLSHTHIFDSEEKIFKKIVQLEKSNEALKEELEQLKTQHAEELQGCQHKAQMSNMQLAALKEHLATVNKKNAEMRLQVSLEYNTPQKFLFFFFLF